MKIKDSTLCSLVEPLNFSAVPAASGSDSSSPKQLKFHDELIICGNSFTTSGLGISFWKTLQCLTHKTVTRRAWKDKHAQKFTNAFHQNKLVKALDKDIRYGGKQIGWCRLLCAPYKEQLSAMPHSDLKAEGGMCDSIEQFIQHYFRGNSSLEVWVIRFEFVALERVASTNTPEQLGVYSDSATKTDSNSAISSLAVSIHQAQLSGASLCYDSASKADSSSPTASATDSIHQASLTPLGVYSAIHNRANSRFSITLATDSIHQASLTLPGVYSAIQYQTNRYFPISLSIESIHRASSKHQTALAVHQFYSNEINNNTAISLPLESIHQRSLPSLVVYQTVDNQTDSNTTNNSLAESIHQAPVIQGGSGLVYSFWKGESIVNHYRYKVKTNGKWQVKSIYIPVGKLPKVKEAIANKLSVAAIVVEILGRNL